MGCSWLGWAYAAGYGHRGWLVSAAVTAVFLVAATASYYSVEAAWSLRLLEPPPYPVPGLDPGAFDVSWVEAMAGSTGELMLWSAASLVAGLVLGIVTAAARREGALGLLARLPLPVGVLLWSVVLLAFEVQLQPRPAVVTAHVLAGLVAVCALLLLVRRARSTAEHRRTELKS